MLVDLVGEEQQIGLPGPVATMRRIDRVFGDEGETFTARKVGRRLHMIVESSDSTSSLAVTVPTEGEIDDIVFDMFTFDKPADFSERIIPMQEPDNPATQQAFLHAAQ